MEQIRYTVREANGSWLLYLESERREVLAGEFKRREDAETAGRKGMEMLKKAEQQVKTDSDALKARKYKFNIPSLREMQAVCLALSDERAAVLRENLIGFNVCVHGMMDCFDNISTLFSAMTDKSVKDHYKQAAKQNEALLNAIYKSKLQGDDDDYCAVMNSSVDIVEDIKMLMSYCVQEGEEWRMREVRETLRRVLPPEYVEKHRREVGERMKDMFSGIDDKIKDK